MSILLIAPNRDMAPVRDKLLELDPDLEIEIWPEVNDRNRVNFALAWNHPEQLLNTFPNLKVVSSLGAGVEHLVSDSSIPTGVSITRLVDPHIQHQMIEYIECCCYQTIRRTTEYIEQQNRTEWRILPHALKRERRVGILGLGQLGESVAGRLSANGWNVSGWARSEKRISGCRCYAGDDALGELLAETHILVNLLPLTSLTSGILDLDLFKQLAQPATLIQTGRGEHLIEEDLIYALDREFLREAFLDVFESEPLPSSHPFWNRSRIRITPHVASLTWPEELAKQILENYKRLVSGLPLLHEADRSKGY